MKAVEILRIGRELLKIMSEYELQREDYCYIGLFYEYEYMRHEHEKYDYIISFLSDKYKISQSKVKRIIRRLSKEVKK